MDRGTWWATVHGLKRVAHNIETKRPATKTTGSLAPKAAFLGGMQAVPCLGPCQGLAELNVTFSSRLNKLEQFC